MIACVKKLLAAPYFERLGLGESALAGVQYAVRIDTVSKDLGLIYYFYLSENTDHSGQYVLGIFNTQQAKKGPSTANGESVNWMAGYQQYRDWLYSSRINMESSTPPRRNLSSLE